VLRAVVLLAPPPAPAGVEAAESVVAEGAGGGVLDKVPGMPAAQAVVPATPRHEAHEIMNLTALFAM